MIFFIQKNLKTSKTKIKSFMKLESALRIFVAILFLISPIDILCEKIPKYTLQNQKQRKLEVNVNYIRVEYGKETTYDANEFKNQFRQSIDYIRYKGNIVDLKKKFKIEANTIIEIFFSEPTTTLKNFFSGKMIERLIIFHLLIYYIFQNLHFYLIL